jgi:hypothetical protein
MWGTLQGIVEWIIQNFNLFLSGGFFFDRWHFGGKRNLDGRLEYSFKNDGIIEVCRKKKIKLSSVKGGGATKQCANMAPRPRSNYRTRKCEV